MGKNDAGRISRPLDPDVLPVHLGDSKFRLIQPIDALFVAAHVEGVAQDLRVGKHVRLREGIKGPPCRTGVVIEDCPDKGGVMVLHDEFTDMGIFGDVHQFGWMYEEVELDPNYFE